MGKIADKYLFQAMDAYPYDLQETIESLDYALAYDAKNTMALCLMGRVYSEKLLAYETAKSYFQEALAEDIHALEIYPHYIDVMLWNEDYDEALKLIQFALGVKGIDKAVIYYKYALYYEYKEDYKMALKQLKLAKKHVFNTFFGDELAEHKTRIKAKMPKKSKKKASKKKAKKSKKKKGKKK